MYYVFNTLHFFTAYFTSILIKQLKLSLSPLGFPIGACVGILIRLIPDNYKSEAVVLTTTLCSCDKAQ